jgi:hypothetical protein
MDVLEAKLSPTNSIVFVADPSHFYQLPPDIGDAPIVSTASCIAIGTLMEQDGETTIRLGASIDDPQGELAFDGEILTPGQTVAVVGSDAENILSMPVSGRTARVKVWVNSQREPDLVIIQAQ